MRKIREKLCSESGASILLALLFFLLCAMVGASVLMAAASNAGKSRSNREEQQKYLTLSSALQLVCDELTHEQTKYVAKYSYEYKETKNPITDDEGHTIGEKIVQIDHIYTQETGDYTGKLSQGTPCVLPLLEELDWLFADSFPESTNTSSGGIPIYYTYNKSSSIKQPAEHTLKLTVPSTDKETGLNEPVTVTVELGTEEGKDKWRFSLKAELESDPSYTMYAELINSGVPKIEEGKSGCDPIGWKLSQITREAPT